MLSLKFFLELLICMTLRTERYCRNAVAWLMRLAPLFECMFRDLHKKLSYSLNLNTTNSTDNADNKEFNRCFIGGSTTGHWRASVSAKFTHKRSCGRQCIQAFCSEKLGRQE